MSFEEKRKWDDMNLKTELLRGIYSYGFENPSDIQSQSIPIMISGSDIISQAQSGMGKTGAFSIGTLEKIDCESNTLQAVLLAPTHELVKQTVNVIRSLGSYFEKLKIKSLIGGTSIKDDADDIKEKCPQIVVGCVGRVNDMFRRKYISGKHVKIIVLDEADEMLSYDFKEQLFSIFNNLKQDVQVALFSATLQSDIMDITESFMKEPKTIRLETEKLSLECIQQYYVALRNDNDKYDTLKDIFSHISVSQCIIYCNSVKRVADLHYAMDKEGYAVGCIHSSMSKSERETEFMKFKKGGYRVLISTNLTARGIDVQQVSVVINFDISKDQHTYLHRIGRSGRWGRKGMAINFITQQDIPKMRKLEKYYNITIDELPCNIPTNLG
jgi:translation initiation factor 4A